MAVASNAQEVVLTDGNEKSIESKNFDVYKNGKRKSFAGILKHVVYGNDIIIYLKIWSLCNILARLRNFNYL